MNQPSVFISCVSPELRQTRSRVAAILIRLGYTPVIQEIFGTEPGDLGQVLCFLTIQRTPTVPATRLSSAPYSSPPATCCDLLRQTGPQKSAKE
jgi:hypothetical protein